MKGRHLLAVVCVSLLASMVTSSTVGGAANAEPVPIPGGAHLFSPGPRSRGMGLHVEPSSISDFQGVVALAYLTGSATDGDSHLYDLAVDLRIMSGDYVAADGPAQTGTFAFI